MWEQNPMLKLTLRKNNYQHIITKVLALHGYREGL